ncbi:MAG: retropepsin-like aspartic protease [Candidatus Zixiibacteriota bacterium]
MRTRSAIFIGVLLLPAMLQAGSIPFSPHRGLVEVNVTLDGYINGSFGIDTGADGLYIDREFAESHNLSLGPVSQSKRVAGVSGVAEASPVSLRSLRITDDETVYNLSAVAVDIGALSKQPESGHPDGLIGHDILRRFYVTVDYPSQRMELHASEPDFIGEESYEEIPFEMRGHLIIVNVTVNDDITVPMVFDYCASLSTISPWLAGQIGYDPDEDLRQTLSSVSLTDEVFSENVQVAITDHSSLQGTVPGARFEGILGASFLYRFKMTVDYKRQKIYVHK